MRPNDAASRYDPPATGDELRSFPPAPLPDPADDLACPGCGADLTSSDTFAALAVCHACRRHFPLPARERLRLLVDADSIVETNAALVSLDPLVFRDLLPVPDRLAAARQRAAGLAGGVGEAVVTGVGAVGGHDAVLIVLDHAYLGGAIGPVVGEKITLAMELAAARRLPLIAICAAGGAHTGGGLLALAQLPKIAAAATQLHRAGVPFVALLAHAATGGVYAGLANQADILLAEPGSQVGLAADAPRLAAAGAATNPAETLLGHGLLDDVVDRARLRPTLANLLGLFADRGAYRPTAPADPTPDHAAASPRSRSLAWSVGLARHPERPAPAEFLRHLITDPIALRGDRLGGDDSVVDCALGRLGGVPVAAVAVGRGRVGAAGYRKAIRVMRLAAHLELPIVTLVDTLGAETGVEAEDAGIGVAVGQALALTGLLPVPIVAAVTGQMGGVGALPFGLGDRMLMLEHAVCQVGPAEFAPSALGPPRDAPAPVAAESGAAVFGVAVGAQECRRLGMIDIVVAEPEPAAHADPAAAARLLGAALAGALAELAGVGPRRLLDDRARKLRRLGQAGPEGREAARREVRDLQDVQRSLARSWGDLRGRWDERREAFAGRDSRHAIRDLRDRLHLPALARREPPDTDLAEVAATAGPPAPDPGGNDGAGGDR